MGMGDCLAVLELFLSSEMRLLIKRFFDSYLDLIVLSISERRAQMIEIISSN